MSIHDILHKIKGEGSVDKTTLMYLLVIVGVGIASFGLGRLSVGTNASVVSDIAITQEGKAYIQPPSSRVNISKNSSKNPVSNDQMGIEKNYLASKHGKLYYTNGCKAANRIKEENRVWFATASDAEQAGYSPSTSCK